MDSPPSSHATSSGPVDRSDSTLLSSLHKIFKTQVNKFSLFHVYNADTPPRHDPEDPYSVNNTCSPCMDSEPACMGSLQEPTGYSYYPYPNKSSMCLGDWYWNQGVQKSKESFKQLLDIVSDPVFSPQAVSQTAWDAINKQLGQNQFDNDLPKWLRADDSWKCSSVTISVPFHSRSRHPGPKDYTLPDFYHRSLISIIKEKITNLTHTSLFHFEPYELRWQPQHRDHDVRVHGELFTSTTFLEAHRALQDSPPEPDCDLPHVVAALMFWSDSTQLTAFGNTKLWPLYVYFGNELKYQRCQPTSNLCSHAAYFQVVSV